MATQSHKGGAESDELPQNVRMEAEANALRVILKEDGDVRPHITTLPASTVHPEWDAHLLVSVRDVTPATLELIRNTEYSVYRYTDDGVRLIREFKADD